jgi:phage terminase Nu1 subunit (DNA packaging protein)
MSEWVSQAEYARHRGVSRQRIGKLIELGKIPAPRAFNPDTKKINVAAADLALGETIERVTAADQEERDADDAPGGAGGSIDDRGTGAGAKLTQARTAGAFYQANLARLQYEEKVGRLVPKADVMFSMTVAAGKLKQDLQQIPSRADDLATAYTRGGVDAVRAFLKTMVIEICGNLSASMRLIQEQSADDDDAGDVTPLDQEVA